MIRCTCGHIRSNHTEHASVPRLNGPASKTACLLCDCWKWTPVVEAKVVRR